MEVDWEERGTPLRRERGHGHGRRPPTPGRGVFSKPCKPRMGVFKTYFRLFRRPRVSMWPFPAAPVLGWAAPTHTFLRVRRYNLIIFKDFYLTVKARIWP